MYYMNGRGQPQVISRYGARALGIQSALNTADMLLRKSSEICKKLRISSLLNFLQLFRLNNLIRKSAIIQPVAVHSVK